MGRRGNLYDNAMMESFTKTLKVEGVYLTAFESTEDVAEHLPPCTWAASAQAMAATGSRSRSRRPVSCSAPTSRHASASSMRAERSA